MKFITYLVSFLLLAIFTQTSAAEIESIEVIDTKTIIVGTSSDISLSSETIEAEIKVLQDTPVGFVGLSLDNNQKLILDLNKSLLPNTSYNLIGIVGVDTIIDFTTGQNITDTVIAEYDVIDEKQSIQEIMIKDGSSVEITFTQPFIESEFEFKILNELSTFPVQARSENEFMIPMDQGLLANSSYIMMILSLKDSTNIPVELIEELNDFMTPIELLEKEEEEVEVEVEAGEKLEGEVGENPSIEDALMLDPLDQEKPMLGEGEEVEFNAAEEENTVIEAPNLESVAANAAVTPETGTATHILILFSVILTGAFIIRKKYL